MKTCLAIVAVAAVVITASFHGIDGALIATGCSFIAGLGGFQLGKSIKGK
jgi:hypothetical protein